jgi:hypothetical protein
MQGKLSLTTPAHVFAASPTIRKGVVDKLKVRRVETNGYEAVEDDNTSAFPHNQLQMLPVCSRPAAAWQWLEDSSDTDDEQVEAHLQTILPRCPLSYCLPLHELDILVQGTIKVSAIYDTGLQIVVIRHDIIQALGASVNEQQLIKMEGANGATNWTVGCAEFLTMQVGSVLFKIHAHVVEDASYGLLLEWPFQQALLCRFEDLPSGKVELSVCGPVNEAHRVYIPTRPRVGRAPAIQILLIKNHTPFPSPPAGTPLISVSPTPLKVFKYKKVAQKIRPVPAMLPEGFQNIRQIPEDPLLSLSLLPTHPPDFSPGE